jgi:hypothetical protein
MVRTRRVMPYLAASVLSKQSRSARVYSVFKAWRLRSAIQRGLEDWLFSVVF